VNWDALVAIGTLALAFATFLSVLAALFGQRLLDWWRRPRLFIAFKREEPFCRYTKTNWHDGPRGGYWVRIDIANEGLSPAHGLRGRLVAVRTEGAQRPDMDPMALRWAGVPDHMGFDPVILARGEHEYLNVAYVVDGESSVYIPTFPGFAPGHPTQLEPHRQHQLNVAVFADDADPAVITLTIVYGDTIDALEVGLT